VNGYSASVTEPRAVKPGGLADTMKDIENKVRFAARGVLAQGGVSQVVLAKAMEVSQSTVSHMLTNRGYGLTTSEISFIEALSRVPQGTIYRSLGFVDMPSLEAQIYDIPGITHQTAEALVAAIHAAKASGLRQSGGADMVKPPWSIERQLES
jgi:hypothetical protein